LAFRAVPRAVICFCAAAMLTALAMVSAFNLGRSAGASSLLFSLHVGRIHPRL
jgi:hypothetical protein